MEPKCPVCKQPAQVTHNVFRFPAGLLADCFHCEKCGAIIGVSRIPNQESQIVKPSTGDVKKLGLN